MFKDTFKGQAHIAFIERSGDQAEIAICTYDGQRIGEEIERLSAPSAGAYCAAQRRIGVLDRNHGNTQSVGIGFQERRQ